VTRVLAIDYGKRRVGLALSDPTRILATGLPTLERKPRRPLPEEIARLVAEHDVGEVVVGHPLNMDGTAGERAREVERFADELRKRLTVPVILRDERLSTVRAWEILRERGTKARAGKAHVDRVAAVVLLQGYLDSAAETTALAREGSQSAGPGRSRRREGPA
jgi:putative Holliday junction resolvase